MKISLAANVGLATAVAFAMGATVAAADGMRTPSMAVPGSSWTGFYVGGNIGGGMASSHFDDPCFYCSSATPTDAFFTGGGQIGYNYQFGSGVLGVEADIAGNDGSKHSVIGGDDTFGMRVGTKADVSGSLRGRAGLVVNNVMPYVTAGFAWANVHQTGVEFRNSTGVTDGTTANWSGTVWGSVIGAGVEYALHSQWTVGFEVLHTTYADHSALIVTSSGSNACGSGFPHCFIRDQLTTDVARLRLNYKLN